MDEKNVKKNRLRNKLINMRYGDVDYMENNMNSRSELRNLLQVKEVRNFYSDLQITLRSGVVGKALNVPEPVEDRLIELVKQYSGLYDEVQVVPIGTDGRVFVSIGEAVAVWGHKNGTIAELESSIDLMELDDRKLSGYFSTPNSVLEDSLIDTVLYLEELMAKALAYGLDDGIVNGLGDDVSVFEPRGILADLPITNDVAIDFDSTSFPALILKQSGLISSGDKGDIGEVVAVMKRKTYYKYVSGVTNSTLPYPNVNGIRVKFSAAVADDVILIGDFKEYILGKRKDITIKMSDQVSFIDDQTVVNIAGRFDGKPHDVAAFVRLTKQIVG